MTSYQRRPGRRSQATGNTRERVVVAAAVAALVLAAILVLAGPAAEGAGPAEVRSQPEPRPLATTVTLEPVKDNTLIESSSGSVSNGAGTNFFSGRTGQPQGSAIRRAVIAFDVSGSIPAGSTITSVTLTLQVSKVSRIDGDTGRTMGLRKLLADWGEGASSTSSGRGASATNGDATWIHTFRASGFWASPGGDFATTVSASATVGDRGSYTWGSSAQMVLDVQTWLDDPGTDFGWILIGDENASTSAKKFHSREASSPVNRPKLTVEFTPPPDPEPGQLQFSAGSYVVEEDGGSATITVTRTQGSDGEVTVRYATSGGTATPALDYTHVSGTVVFGTGDTGDKSFQVPVVDDGLVEGAETVELVLSDPAGGATLGNPAGATLTIGSNDLEVDVDEDGQVGGRDLWEVSAALGTDPPDPNANVDGENGVDVLDLARVAVNVGRAAPRPLAPMQVERAFPNLGFQRLTNLVQPDDGSELVFITEQAGLVRVFVDRQDAIGMSVFLDITNRVIDGGDEEGLLGLAFDPEYRENGHFYVYYSATPRRSVVSRFTVSANDPEIADPGSELVIMEVPQPFENHNGGQLAFGPDGYLYIGLGDGGSGGDPQGHGQDTGTLLGSILRVDVSAAAPGDGYRVPPDNPLVGEAGVREEIWAYGLRNPWRFSFDGSGRLWAGDVGQGNWEEVDIIRSGGNYGWNCFEGSHVFSACATRPVEHPVWEYDHSSGDCSITGGHIYEGRGVPSLLGAYLYADYCSGRVWALRHDGANVTEQSLLVDSDLLIVSFGRDSAGNLYLLSRDEGIYRLVPR